MAGVKDLQRLIFAGILFVVTSVLAKYCEERVSISATRQNSKHTFEVGVCIIQCYFQLSPGGRIPPSKIPPEKHPKYKKMHRIYPPDMCPPLEPGV